MFKRFTDGIFALGLVIGGAIAIISTIWIIGLNYCPNHSCQYTQAANDPDGDAGQRVWQVPDAIRGTFSYEPKPEYAKGDPTRHETYDLRAQERMAHATDWIAWLTFATGVLSVFGLGALIYTLNLQREANRTTREIGEAQVQAHLMPKKTEVRVAGCHSNGVEGRSFFTIFTGVNVGSTPAYRVSFKAVIDGVEPSDGWKPVSPRDVSPNGEFEIKYMSDTQAITTDGVDELYRLAVYIRFDTIFTRGAVKKAERIRFDYRIKRDANGNSLVERI